MQESLTAAVLQHHGEARSEEDNIGKQFVCAMYPETVSDDSIMILYGSRKFSFAAPQSVVGKKRPRHATQPLNFADLS